MAITILVIGLSVRRLLRAQDPDLMQAATRVVTMSRFSGFDRWLSNKEVTLYRWQRQGAALFRYNISTRTITPSGVRQTGNPSVFNHGPFVLCETPKDDGVVLEAWKHERGYHQVPAMPRPDYVWRVKLDSKANATLYDYALSFDARRIAYFSRRVHQAMWDKVIQRFRPSYPVREWQGGTLYVSDVDGSRTVCIGYVEPDMPNSGSRFAKSGMTASLQGLAWLPNGKHLSFRYGDGLYTVPVE